VHDNYPPAALSATRNAAAAGEFSARREALRADLTPFRKGMAAAYEAIDEITDETIAAYVGPLLSSPERTANLERWLTLSGDNSQTTEIEPQLRQLPTPTLIVWGTDDVFFPLKWAYWLKDTIPGATKVVELEGARLFFPDERPEPLVAAMREHWRDARIGSAA
jgi:pimeloyl-ACP methyl ester carboxylesterase